MTETQEAIITSSGNVFADLGLPNPEERLLKSRLASMIYDVIEARGWTQKHVAEVLGITQPDISHIVNGKLKNFSTERLMYFLSKLDQRVTITVQDENGNTPPQEIIISNEGKRQPLKAVT